MIKLKNVIKEYTDYQDLLLKIAELATKYTKGNINWDKIIMNMNKDPHGMIDYIISDLIKNKSKAAKFKEEAEKIIKKDSN